LLTVVAIDYPFAGTVNIPPDPKDDKALHTALDLIRGIQKNSAYPPNPKVAVPN
jgi:hypothetical protein